MFPPAAQRQRPQAFVTKTSPSTPHTDKSLLFSCGRQREATGVVWDALLTRSSLLISCREHRETDLAQKNSSKDETVTRTLYTTSGKHNMASSGSTHEPRTLADACSNTHTRRHRHLASTQWRANFKLQNTKAKIPVSEAVPGQLPSPNADKRHSYLQDVSSSSIYNEKAFLLLICFHIQQMSIEFLRVDLRGRTSTDYQLFK